jgi:hypothetical protein
LITVAPGIPGNFAILQNPPGTLNSSISGFYSFQWVFQSGTAWLPIPAPQGQQSTYIPPIGGFYGLIATNPEGCTDTAFFNFNGTSFEVFESSVQLYPNPAKNQINIHVEGSEILKLSILDFAGRIISEQSWTEGQSNIELSLNGWQSGYYFALVEGPLGRRALPFIKIE